MISNNHSHLKSCLKRKTLLRNFGDDVTFTDTASDMDAIHCLSELNLAIDIAYK